MDSVSSRAFGARFSGNEFRPKLKVVVSIKSNHKSDETLHDTRIK